MDDENLSNRLDELGLSVELKEYTPDPEELSTWAALISYWEDWSSDALEEVNREDVDDHLRRVLGYGHETVIEHANFTFAIEGCSRVCTHQLVRHRLASYTQQSQRYVKIEEDEEKVFQLPDSIKGSELEDEVRDHYRDSMDLYEDLLDAGIPKEDARFVFPQSVRSKIVVTMNARELLHFFNLRTCYRAQWEIREMAWSMLKQVKEVAPVIFKEAGPPCVRTGECPFGELTCRELDGVLRIYDRLNDDID